MTPIHVVLQIGQVASEADDLYLDDTGSGGFYPEDDDDFNSGSGSGKSTCTSTHQLHVHVQQQRQSDERPEV